MIPPTWYCSSRLARLPLIAATLSLWLHPILFVGCCWSNNSPNPYEQLQVARFKVRGRWIVDQYGRVRLFHGFNSVVKGPPFIDYEIFNRTRLDLYRQWGFNVVRLGTMWAGAQPTNAHGFNETYLTELLDAVRLLAEYDIFVIMDMHQDVMSTAFNSYDGVPRWLIDKLPASRHRYPWPITQPIGPDNWATGYITEAVGTAFQQLYNNTVNAADNMAVFWTRIASIFGNQPNVLGYELINEPWAGDIYHDASLLAPGQAGERNLMPLYNRLNTAIRTIDNATLLFYEPVTWGIFLDGKYTGSGFRTVPGGAQFNDRSVMSYHYYCWLLNPDEASEKYPFWERLACDDVISREVLSNIVSEVDSLGGSSFLTEFGLCSPDGNPDSVNTIECQSVIDRADDYLQSWTYWDSSFFDSDSNAQGENSSINWNAVRVFSRVYARAVGGTPVSMTFDSNTNRFRLEWLIDTSIKEPTEVFVPDLHYAKTGFSVTVSRGLTWKFNTKTSVVYVTLPQTNTSALVDLNAFIDIRPTTK